MLAAQVNLPGPSDPEPVVTGVAPAGRPDGLYLEIGLSNRGWGLTKGEGTVTLPDEGFERTFPIGTFVPGTSIAYPIKWADRAEDGDYRARVEVRDNERVVESDGTFTVGRAVQEELAERQSNRLGREMATTAVSSSPPWPAPWSPAGSSPPAALSPSSGSDIEEGMGERIGPGRSMPVAPAEHRAVDTPLQPL